jgi:hypothetical protein
MDVVISFDDTGSMSSVRKQVRQKINALVEHLFRLNEKIRMGIIIHNDYCDRDTIQHMDLTDDKDKIISFVNRGSSCGGGDSDECYELAINYFHTQFSWKDEKRIAIIIGDCEPHEKGYRLGGRVVNNLDWKEELQSCIDKSIKVYPVQALGWGGSKRFYDYIAKVNNTPKLDLSQFAHITQFITAILYNEEGKLEDYENSNSEFKTNSSLKKMFAKLKGLIVEDDEPYARRVSIGVKDYGDGDGTKTIDLDSRFQVLDVGVTPRVIKEFVEDNGAEFKKGRGFYQFILTETIQENKEVLFVDKLTGEVKSDTVWCRKQLGVPLGTRGRVNPKSLECSKHYDMFIQSTSYNRKLDPNTKFLYELDYK